MPSREPLPLADAEAASPAETRKGRCGPVNSGTASPLFRRCEAPPTRTAPPEVTTMSFFLALSFTVKVRDSIAPVKAVLMLVDCGSSLKEERGKKKTHSKKSAYKRHDKEKSDSDSFRFAKQLLKGKKKRGS